MKIIKYLLLLLATNCGAALVTNVHFVLTTNSVSSTQFNTSVMPMILTNIIGANGASTNYWTTNIAAAASISNTFPANVTIGTNVNSTTFNGVKVYRALINQSSTSAPVPTVLENTIGAIVWGYTSAGVYTATLSGAFPAGKTTYSPRTETSAATSPRLFKFVRTDDNTMTLSSQQAFGASLFEDGQFPSNWPLEILVYP